MWKFTAVNSYVIAHQKLQTSQTHSQSGSEIYHTYDFPMFKLQTEPNTITPRVLIWRSTLFSKSICTWVAFPQGMLQTNTPRTNQKKFDWIQQSNTRMIRRKSFQNERETATRSLIFVSINCLFVIAIDYFVLCIYELVSFCRLLGSFFEEEINRNHLV